MGQTCTFRSLFPHALAHRAAQGCISKRASTTTARVPQVCKGEISYLIHTFQIVLGHRLADRATLFVFGVVCMWAGIALCWLLPRLGDDEHIGRLCSFLVLLSCLSLSFPLYDTWPKSSCAFLLLWWQLGRVQLHHFAYDTFSHFSPVGVIVVLSSSSLSLNTKVVAPLCKEHLWYCDRNCVEMLASVFNKSSNKF